MGGACSTYGDKIGAYVILVWRREGKRPLGSPGVDGRMILNRILKWDWLLRLRIATGVWALVNAVMNFRVTG
jgi:hypothetical protein